MIKRCTYPKCYATKNNKKCMAPNSWIIFLRKNGGKKLSRRQISQQFKAWKHNVFPENSSVAQRRRILCDASEKSFSKKVIRKTVKSAAIRRLRKKSAMRRLSASRRKKSTVRRLRRLQAKRVIRKNVKKAAVRRVRQKARRIIRKNVKKAAVRRIISRERAEGELRKLSEDARNAEALARTVAIREGDKIRTRRFVLQQEKIARSAALRSHEIRVGLEKNKLRSRNAKRRLDRDNLRANNIISAARRRKGKLRSLEQKYGPDVFTDAFSKDYRILYNEFVFVHSSKRSKDARKIQRTLFPLRKKISLRRKKRRNAAKVIQRAQRKKNERVAGLKAGDTWLESLGISINKDKILFNPENMDLVIKKIPKKIKVGYQFRSQGLKDLRDHIDYLAPEDILTKSNKWKDFLKKEGYPSTKLGFVTYFQNQLDGVEDPEVYVPGEADSTEQVLDRIKLRDERSFDSGNFIDTDSYVHDISEIIKGFSELASREEKIVQIQETVDEINDFVSSKSKNELDSFLAPLNLVPDKPAADNSRLETYVKNRLDTISKVMNPECSLEEKQFNDFVENVMASYKYKIKDSKKWEHDSKLQLLGTERQKFGNDCENMAKFLNLGRDLIIKSFLGSGVTASVFLARRELFDEKKFASEAIKVTYFNENVNREQFWYGVHVHREVFEKMETMLRKKVVYNRRIKRTKKSDDFESSEELHKSVVISRPLFAETMYRTNIQDSNLRHHYAGVLGMSLENATEIRQILIRVPERREEMIKKYARALKILHLGRFSPGDAHSSNFMEESNTGGKIVVIDMDRVVNLRPLSANKQKIAVSYDLKFVLRDLFVVFKNIYVFSTDEVVEKLWNSWVKLFSEAYMGKKTNMISYRNIKIVSVNDLTYSKMGKFNIDKMFDQYKKQVWFPAIDLKIRSMLNNLNKF